jgi:hypothetical protein
MFHVASASHSIWTTKPGSEHAAARLIADADTGPTRTGVGIGVSP